MTVTFRDVAEFEGWDKFPGFIEQVIARHALRRVCEVGAGANPALSPDVVRRYGLYYRATDESSSEMQKSGMAETAVCDVCQQDAAIPGAPYDLIFSRMTAEHFRDSASAFRNMLRALAPGGLSVHCFATFYTLPFVLNRVLSDGLANFLYERFALRDREKHDKFKAYYSRCRGPRAGQIRFLQEIGYEVLEYRAHFGHNYYAPRLPLLHALHRAKTNLLLRMPLPLFTSYATIILRRPRHA
jgi:hypothetical protein